MSKIKILAGETVLYGFGSIVPRMLNFFLLTPHTNIFSLSEYGSVTKLYAFVAFVNIVFMFGMETAFFRFANKPNANTTRIFNLTQTCVVLISIPLTLLCIVFSSPIAAYMDVATHPEFITWLSLVMLTDALVAIPFARLRLEKKAFQFASAKIINVVILLGLNLYFLKISYDPSINIGYVFLANLIANTFFVLFFLKTLIAWRPVFDKEISPEMLHYAYPVMLTGVAGTTNEMFSRLSLDWWLPTDFYKPISNQAAVGVFGACYKFAVLMNLGIQAFRYAAEPFFFSQAADKNSPALFAKVNHYFVIVGCIVFLGISINLDIFQLLIGTDFRSGISIVPILLMAYLLLGVYYNFSVWFKLTDKTYYGTLITVGGAALTVGANFLLIPIMGYTGSSWAALLCYAFMAACCYLLGQKYFPIPYRLGTSLGYLICTIVITYAVQAVTLPNQWITSIFHGLVIISFVGAVYFFERSGLKSAIVDRADALSKSKN
ncbi:MAG: polysaccharide biosynthesis C-terminal domain-containing protein [Cyclobacteriaceae bacterium]|nr:polysaccharide biosynthesis C-terminal domain-containing protein [Cyclobacteriaceae bacterium]